MRDPFRLLSRLRAGIGRQPIDERLREEFADHLERATRDNLDRGMSPAEARRAALIAFGGIAPTTEACRDVSRFAPLRAVLQDIRYAWRIYRKTPVVTFATILTATLAIGATTTVFTLLNALALRDLPVRDPGSLVRVAPLNRDGSRDRRRRTRCSGSWLSSPRTFESVMGMWGMSMQGVEFRGEFTTGGLWAVTGNVYEELGVRPALGRLLTPRDGGLIPLSAAARRPCSAMPSGSVGCTAIPDGHRSARFESRVCHLRSWASHRPASRASASPPSRTSPFRCQRSR